MMDLPPDLDQKLRSHDQQHLAFGWEALAIPERTNLVEQLAGLDFEHLKALYAKKDEPNAVLPSREQIEPLPVELRSDISPQVYTAGEDAIRRGEVAVLLVAGGQGSRLGSDRPKGVWPVGPVSGASLFQIHAEKVLALRRRYRASVPFLVMTSPATHHETTDFFAEHQYFGLPKEAVHFFQQGTMPALDIATGRLLLEKPGQLFLSPNGHGGTLTALADSGLLAKLKAEGVRHVFYFQVDNPLVRIADPAFVGRHIETDSEVSSKVVFKEKPEEKVGVLSLVNGRCTILEYSDLPEAMTRERTPTGELAFRAGSPAIHLFSVPFLERVTSGATRLAHHLARKKVPCLDAAGKPFTPTCENALKFELFVFDALPLADRWLAVAVERADEFSPLKNAKGADSPDTVRKDSIARAARWLEAAGVAVPRSNGEPTHALEISPLFALDETESRQKVDPALRITGPTLLS
ncbi:UTP--glucose-1-phosphate uridylyltransferase [Limnoglobus roseus]|uniref:UDPGP type 1 family protein n=1 Tax=Limnoglobus roseus TaxID=2598579 RepID=A0A5C1AHZ2_9BACT|nr:UDPGP type 1 family protein [Limnoglobus roseus]QEL18811.1 UDPGP type 1 family protein [Limnoglobus roseus]